MKTNIIKSIAALSLGVLLMTGCQTTEEQSLRLSTVMTPFSYKGGTEIIEVVTSGSDTKNWTVKAEDPSNTWAKLGAITTSSVAIEVSENEGALERRAIFVFQAGKVMRELTVVQRPYEANIARYRDLSAWNSAGISPNGKFVAGFITDVDKITDKFLYYPVIVDVENDEWHTMDPIPDSEIGLDYVGAVTDDGTVYFDADGSGLVIDLAGNRQRLAPLTGFKFSPVVQQVSADGNTSVGYAVKSTVDGPEPESGNYADFQYGYWPIMYKDGVGTTLERPALSVKGDFNWGGALARGISATGDIIYGSGYGQDQHGEHYEAMWWKNGKVAYVGKSDDNSEIDGWKKNVVEIKTAEGEWADKPFTYHYGNYIQCTAEPHNASYSGKYIAFTYVEESFSRTENTVSTARIYPAFFNTENETVLILKELPGYSATTVNDDGTGFVTSIGIGGASGGMVVDLNNGGAVIEQSLAEWVKSKYDNLEIPSTNPVIKFFNPTSNVSFWLTNGRNAQGNDDTSFFYIAPKE